MTDLDLCDVPVVDREGPIDRCWVGSLALAGQAPATLAVMAAKNDGHEDEEGGDHLGLLVVVRSMGPL